MLRFSTEMSRVKPELGQFGDISGLQCLEAYEDLHVSSKSQYNYVHSYVHLIREALISYFVDSRQCEIVDHLNQYGLCVRNGNRNLAISFHLPSNTPTQTNESDKAFRFKVPSPLSYRPSNPTTHIELYRTTTAPIRPSRWRLINTASPAALTMLHCRSGSLFQDSVKSDQVRGGGDCHRGFVLGVEDGLIGLYS